MTAPLAAAVLLALAGCSRTQAAADADTSPERGEVVYSARLTPLNTGITGSTAAGEVTFSMSGDDLTIATTARGLPPDMSHWQHFHGFTDGREARCPSADADANGDGIVDLIETEPVSGTTMVPFNDDPVAMDVPRETYPRSSTAGELEYRETVSLGALDAAFRKAFEGQELDLERRVVYVHGVPEGTDLPASVQSLGPIPAHVTLPIACGEIERVS